MIVTLATGDSVGAGASQTYQYTPKSFQSVYIEWNGSADDLSEATLQVQVGNEVVCNTVSLWGLMLLHGVQHGGMMTTEASATNASVGVNFGSWELNPGQEIYVTVNNPSSAGYTLSVAVKVDELGPYRPIYYRGFTDTSFTAENVISSYIWSATAISNDTQVIQIINSNQSSAPTVESCVLVSGADGMISEVAQTFVGVLTDLGMALDTSYNYTTARNILCQCMGDKRNPVAVANAKRRVRSQITALKPGEKKAL